MIKAEIVKNCKLVKSRNISDGHDCWGNYESHRELYVIINGTEHIVYDDMYVIYNDVDNEIFFTSFDWAVKSSIQNAKNILESRKQLKLF